MANPTGTFPRVAFDWLKHENDPQLYREEAVILSGSGNLLTGSVLGKITASGKYKLYAPAAVDGSQTAVAILLSNADATSSDAKCVIVTGKCEIAPTELTWHASVDDNTKKATGLGQLKLKDIFARNIV